EVPPQIEAEASLAFASVLGRLSLISGNRARPKQEADTAFSKAIDLAGPYPSLHFRVRNEYAVFLLQSDRSRAAEILLASMQSELKGQTPVAISRYEYNFGQALMEGRGGAEALPHYLASFKADPSFLPAADAILIAVRTITEPDIGVQAIKSITDISL